MPCDDGSQTLRNFVNLAQAECAAAMASVPELPEESGGVRSPRLSLDRLACRQQQAPQSPTCRLTELTELFASCICVLWRRHM